MLFKAMEFTGTLVSSEEGNMEWVEYSRIADLNTVDDFAELLEVMNSPELTEFQYIVKGDAWEVSVK